MRKCLLGTAALIALVSPAISADLGHPAYDAAPAAPQFGAGPAATWAAMRVVCGVVVRDGLCGRRAATSSVSRSADMM